MTPRLPAETPAADAMLQALGAQLRARRKTLGVSATAAAETAGVSRVTWYRIEKGAASVAAGAYASAAEVLGLNWVATERKQNTMAGHEEVWLPLRIRLADYPGLKQLAWQLQGADTLTPREALSIYARNARHLDMAALAPHERALIDALHVVFDGGEHDV